jgi:hypothetical protein
MRSDDFSELGEMRMRMLAPMASMQKQSTDMMRAGKEAAE